MDNSRAAELLLQQSRVSLKSVSPGQSSTLFACKLECSTQLREFWKAQLFFASPQRPKVAVMKTLHSSTGPGSANLAGAAYQLELVLTQEPLRILFSQQDLLSPPGARRQHHQRLREETVKRDDN
ncbi:hypothetical protein J6590_037921 [Homalodisca vitripennis]|nr:hypothetical protein J6590_037921 [Homalodisca vitripennis]